MKPLRKLTEMSTITNYIRDFFHWNNDFVSNQTYKYYYPLYKKLFGVKFVRAWDNLVKEGWIRKSRVELGYFWQIPNPQNECYGCGEKTDKGRFVYLCHKCFERYGDAMSLWYDSFSEDEENPGLPRGEEIMLRLRIGDEITIMTWPLRTPKVVEAFERLGLDVQVENLNTDQDIITLRDKFWLQEPEDNPIIAWDKPENLEFRLWLKENGIEYGLALCTPSCISHYRKQFNMAKRSGWKPKESNPKQPDLLKELHKLQRELNSSRLRTYQEGDNSDEQKARNKEREIKLARFNEILKILHERDPKHFASPNPPIRECDICGKDTTDIYQICGDCLAKPEVIKEFGYEMNKLSNPRLWCEKCGMAIDDVGKHIDREHQGNDVFSKDDWIRFEEDWIYDLDDEVTENPLSEMPPTDSTKSALRAGILAEMDAINLYEQLAVAPFLTSDIRELFRDISREEAVHVGEFHRALETMDEKYQSDFQKGKNEADEILNNPREMWHCDICDERFADPDAHVEDNHANDPRCSNDDAIIVFQNKHIHKLNPVRWKNKYEFAGFSGWDGGRNCHYCGRVKTEDGKVHNFHFQCPHCGAKGKELDWNWHEAKEKDNLTLVCPQGHKLRIDEGDDETDEWIVLDELKNPKEIIE